MATQIKIIKDVAKAKEVNIPNTKISRPENEIGSAGVGFIVLPSDITREDYIADCYRTNTVSMFGGWGYGNFDNVPVDEEVMKRIQFPTTVEEKGTAVIWVKDDISQLPVVIATVRKQDEYYALKENQFCLKKEPKNTSKSVELFLDGNESSFQINVIGDKDKIGKLNIKVTSENENSEVNLFCDNKVNISAHNDVSVNSMGEVNIISAKSILAKIIDENDKERVNIAYNAENGFAYTDEFKNSIKCSDGKIEVVSKDKNGEITICGKTINHNDGSESMVLGDTLKDTLSDLIDAILAITVVTPSGPSSTPSNAVQFTNIKAKLSQFLSKKSKLD